MREIVEKARAKIISEPDSCYYRWFGAMYRESDVFTRLDKTFLYCIYTHKGEPRYNKIIGYPDRVSNSAGTEECINFTTDIVYRITSKPRIGRIYPIEKLRENEKAVVAGVHKKLEFKNEPDKLHTSREHDKFMIRLLKEILEGDVQKTEGITCPELYLCCSQYNNSLYLRSGQGALKYISGFEEYDSGETPEENIKKMKNVLAVPAGHDKNGNQRLGYPFRYIYGKGVKTVSPELNGQWYKCKLQNCTDDRGYVRFKFVEE